MSLDSFGHQWSSFKMTDSDDDTPTLSADTLSALNEFYAEQTKEQKQIEEALQAGQIKDVNLKEDWVINKFLVNNRCLCY
jgi:hypothetical protein